MSKFKQEVPAPRACQSVIRILAHFFPVVKKKKNKTKTFGYFFVTFFLENLLRFRQLECRSAFGRGNTYDFRASVVHVTA